MVRERTLQPFKAMGLAVILAANIFLFVPSVLYMGNLDEFVVSLPTILGYYRLPAVFFIAACGLIGALLPAANFRAYLVFLGAVGILLWLQSNMLVWEYGLLDGRTIDWTVGAWRGWVDLGIWITAILIALFFQRRLGKPIIYVAVVTFILQLTFSAITGMQMASRLSEKSGIEPSASALAEVYRFSSDKNVVHLIVDGFQSDLFEEIINEGEDGKHLASALNGFVFFKEHMGVFPYTHMSVPAILSGKIYQNHIPNNEFLEEAMGGETIVSAARNAGYEIDLISPGGLLYSTYTKVPYTNAYLVPPRNHVTGQEYELIDAAKLIDLALFRVTPHFLKRYVYNEQLWLVQSILSNSAEYMQLEFFAHKAVLSQFAEHMSADRPTPVYKLFHLMLVHNPMVTDTNCEYAGQVLPTVRVTAKIQAKCSLVEVVKLLEKMKELGIYDDALIVLMADHGVWVPPAGLKAAVGPDGQMVAMNPTIVAQALPLMAVKQPGASGPLQTSMAPSWIVDTPATIASILGLKEEFDGISVFDIPPEEPRERTHYYYKYERSEWEADYLNPLQEFIIKGSVFETKDWQHGDRFLPNGVVEERRLPLLGKNLQ